MALNPAKSDSLRHTTAPRNNVASHNRFLYTVKILGATFDSSLTVGLHIKTTSKSCFYHIRSFRQIRSSMDHTMAISVASALISSRLDFAVHRSMRLVFNAHSKHL